MVILSRMDSTGTQTNGNALGIAVHKYLTCGWLRWSHPYVSITLAQQSHGLRRSGNDFSANRLHNKYRDQDTHEHDAVRWKPEGVVDALLVVGLFLISVVIVECFSGRIHTVSQTDAWRQAVTGLIQEPVPVIFVHRSAVSTPTTESATQTKQVPAAAVADRETSVTAHPGVAPIR